MCFFYCCCPSLSKVEEDDMHISSDLASLTINVYGVLKKRKPVKLLLSSHFSYGVRGGGGGGEEEEVGL